ncbi:proton-conducting transporter membrane subunit [Halorubrum ezzemoulense]|uniref:proton-conducting transporter transmembrane domain-containing protein n=1 Tax=Halorubrum ezzemoulense TaxID=337243 RepID=UPI00232E6359|nr:proton-conducting transporter membrane subunit [Halorubrum ezzemoulense]MDB9249824.1 proton-conducting transporter membrane subunit [Halorubrum ezzemoulense]MDB9259819.1 proton-conducting transporter membrane subunit [Halorubrum ezzemoulense]MDB9263284.1 proton-conducting transporter membrane subunit [Halorubrum ezzemoulense]MDB9266869.1 proton-conducting transporter membrane subunit [Halorubrum ezzemoulense]MDB9270180.1 proton-conducting transporter membrane subunit [Halorubrum ezzemoulens
MSGPTSKTTVGALRKTTDSSFVSAVLTWLAWSLFAASVAVLVARLRLGASWEVPGAVAVDGLTVLLWTVVTFFSGIVHSYSRRYMAGSAHETDFFLGIFSFTLAVMALVAADHLTLFWLCWLAMGLLMARLIGTVDGWPQARAAASVARRHFLASSALLGVALATLWRATEATTISGIAASADGLGGPTLLVAGGALVLAAMIQSALVPFHGWLLSSMTAPTPASALMHAGFVNAGGILLTRFAPVVTAETGLMLALVVAGAASALGGKLLKTVRSDVKGELGCSTVGQMGFMIVQAGLGFFAAAVTHLVLHGFYKAYHFLSAGDEVERTAPTETESELGGTGVAGAAVVLLTGLAGGATFAVLTGKGTSLDSGLLLAGFVTLTTLHAARSAVRQTGLSTAARYGAVPLVALPAIAVYALAYEAVSGLLAGLPVVSAPTELTALHALVGVAFLAAYVAIETGVYERSERLYVALLNAGQPAPETVLTATEEYDER